MSGDEAYSTVWFGEVEEWRRGGRWGAVCEAKIFSEDTERGEAMRVVCHVHVLSQVESVGLARWDQDTDEGVVAGDGDMMALQSGCW